MILLDFILYDVVGWRHDPTPTGAIPPMLGKISKIAFSTLLLLACANTWAAAPRVANPIQDQTWTGSGSKTFQVPANTFRDADGDTLTYSARRADGSALPSWLRFNRSTRTFSGNPPTGILKVGLRVTASDGRGGTASSAFTLNLAEANDVPRIKNRIANQTWGGSGLKSFLVPSDAFSDDDGDALNFSATLEDGSALPSWLRFSTANRIFSGNPPADTVALGLKVIATDSQGAAVSDMFGLSFNRETNDRPTVRTPVPDQTWTGSGNKSFQVPENTFSDRDGDILTFSARRADGSALPSWLTFDATTRIFSGNPRSGVGAIDLKVVADDGNGGTAARNFTLSFNSTNDAPVVANPIASQTWSGSGVKSFQIPESTFSDGDGDDLRYSATLADSAALPSWLRFNASTRTLSGNPTAGTSALNLSIWASDRKGGTVNAPFTLTFSETNDAPIVATPIAAQTWSGSGTQTFQIPATVFADPDGDNLTYTTTLANGSALPSWLTFSPTTRMFSGNPPANAPPLNLKLTADDGHGGVVNSTFALVVSNSNDAPTVVAPISTQNWAGSGTKSFQIPATLFSDVDGDGLTYTATQADGSALPSWLTFSPASRTFSGNPPAGLASLNLKVTASDDHGGTTSSSFDLDFSGVNDAPVAVANTLTTPKNTAVIDTLSGVDADGDRLTYHIVTNGAKGNATVNTTSGSVTYAPTTGMSGTDSFSFKVNDGNADSTPATVTVTIVAPPNAAPVAVDGSLNANQGIVTTGTLSAHDEDGNTLTYQIVANGSKGTATITNQTTGAFSYTPNSGSTGTDTFTFRVNDGTDDSNMAMVAITIIRTIAPVAKSGQTTSQDSGDDGRLQKGVAWPSPRFIDNGDGTVKDNLTGLVWMKNANCWGSQMWTNALTKVDGLNAQTESCSGYVTGTHTDWRLPNSMELRSLIDYGRYNPALPAGHPFSGVQSSDYYWSSTTQAGSTDLAWVVHLTNGTLSEYVKYVYPSYVWPVRCGEWGQMISDLSSCGIADDATAPARRSGQTTSYVSGDDGQLQKGVTWPTPRFTDNGDGTVKDNLTELIWMKNANCWRPQTWTNALTKVAGLNARTESCAGYTTGTHTDWRLPQLNELESLVDAGRHNPALPTGHPFSGDQSSSYWSSTTYIGSSAEAWRVYLREGSVNIGLKSYQHDVWPVRGGQ
ncbi:MAG: DUF1566 domain-containing protein [Magnetococcales bacterium]|nr:DUF1566 domain-containing protein [Magnetococcales bacterium]